jgi:uncharacterized protein (UPF0335 family)
MKNDKLIKQILSRIDRLEKVVFRSEKKNLKKCEVVTGSGMKLPKHILALREKDFFKQPKISSEVHAKLESNYPCDLNRVAVALVRLSKRRKIRKTSKIVNKKRLTAYVW